MKRLIKNIVISLFLLGAVLVDNIFFSASAKIDECQITESSAEIISLGEYFSPNCLVE